MNPGGKQNQRSSWWAPSAIRTDWLSSVRSKIKSKTTATRTGGLKQERKIER